MRRSNINFHKSNSDRKAERSLRVLFYRKFEPILQIKHHIYSHITKTRDKIHQLKLKGRYN